MKAAGALRVFERSLATRALKYKDMLGDGGSSSYSSIVESMPYGEDCVPNKPECVGHVQKRVGSQASKAQELQQRCQTLGLKRSIL